MPILNFCDHEFLLVKEDNVSVERLRQLAEKAKAGLFVIFDPQQHAAALILPELVTSAVSYFKWEPEASAADVGLLSFLRRGQLTVNQGQEAGQVARLAIAAEAWAVLVLDPKGKPVGVFLPRVVAARLSSRSAQASFPPILAASRVHPQGFYGLQALPWVLEELDREVPGFHNENLNSRAADPYWCDAGHNVEHCPCSVHIGSNCARREVLRSANPL
jgi:hypothetical protein